MTAPTYEALLAFAQDVAERKKDGEYIDPAQNDGDDTFVLENDDAYDAYMGFVSDARNLLGIADPEAPDETGHDLTDEASNERWCKRCGRIWTSRSLLPPSESTCDRAIERDAAVRATLTPNSGKRQCLYVDESMLQEGGYVPSLVTEGEPGHAPLVGRGRLAQPWYFGRDIEQAKRLVVEANAKLGVTEADATAIVLSSMAAGRP
jgi:hypothetical protein